MGMMPVAHHGYFPGQDGHCSKAKWGNGSEHCGHKGKLVCQTGKGEQRFWTEEPTAGASRKQSGALFTVGQAEHLPVIGLENDGKGSSQMTLR